MKNIIEQKLEQIAEIIYNHALIYHKKSEGLYGESAGLLLFLFYYGSYSNQDRFTSLADNFCDHLLNQLNEKIHSHTFCDGLSGTLYLLEYLKENQFIELDISESQKILDNYLIRETNKDMQNLYYDFMHGALGSGLYFLKVKTNSNFLENIVDFLEQTAEKDTINHQYKWKSPLGITREIGYNISLSHGISGIVIFLVRYLTNNPNNKKAYELMKGAVNYILSQRINFQKYGSHFPSYSIDYLKPDLLMSRLGWCYGDLGVAISLWQAGKLLNNNEWQTIALDVLSDSTKRRNFSETKVLDAGICHGSAGIAMIYNRLHTETGFNIFLSTTDYWMEQTLNHSHFKDGLAGYKSYEGDGWKNKVSLLEGITGIGLMMISYLSNDKQPWDEFFLLS